LRLPFPLDGHSPSSTPAFSLGPCSLPPSFFSSFSVSVSILLRILSFLLSFSVLHAFTSRLTDERLPCCSHHFMSALYVLTHRVHLFLAYLSNPSETSFRSYLTEQSFRHHLSRLDDPADFDSDRDGSNRSSSSSQSSSTFGSLESGSSAFHFSNRAAVALRTPRHAFHSFGLFTIAAVIPSHKLFLHLVTRPPLAPLRGTPRVAPIPIPFHSRRPGSSVHSVDGGEVAWSTPSGHLAILLI
jgi:hypothetical protein